MQVGSEIESVAEEFGGGEGEEGDGFEGGMNV